MRRGGAKGVTLRKVPAAETVPETAAVLAVPAEIKKLEELKIEEEKPEKEEVEATLESILKSILNELPKEPNVISRLIDMRDKTGLPVLSLQDREDMYQIIGMLQFMSLSDMEKYFAAIVYDEDSIWNSAVFYQELQKEYLDAEIFLNRIRVKVGAAKCKYCGSQNVIQMEKQTRSADEGMTTKFTCLDNPNHRWTDS